MKGYKVFNEDWTCRNKQYTCPGYFEENVVPKVCEAGMHFCKIAVDCFNYYNFDPNYHVAEIEAVGEIDTDGKKSCTNKLKIIREIPWDKVLRLVNIGKNCTGKSNTGNCNTGDYNTGDYNTGKSNTGDRNTGNCNTGKCNTGNYNTGDCNIGDFNTGDFNTGYCNTGDWNFSSYTSGCFCTEDPKIRMFDKETNWTFDDWYGSNGCRTMSNCPQNTKTTEWIREEQMSEEEKKDNPTYKITGGYLKVDKSNEDLQKWWDNLKQRERRAVYELPNFDAEKFYKCTGIKVDIHEISGK